MVSKLMHAICETSRHCRRIAGMVSSLVAYPAAKYRHLSATAGPRWARKRQFDGPLERSPFIQFLSPSTSPIAALTVFQYSCGLR